MIKTIFISATNTNVGKTYATLRLIEHLSEMGYKVGVLKPIETGVVHIPMDAQELFTHACKYNEELKTLALEDICPYQFELPAAPYVAKKGDLIEIEIISKALEKIAHLCDIVLIEGAGGLMVPVDENLFMIDIVQLFADKLLLVVPSRLGSINDTLLNKNLLESRNIEFEWAVNIFEDAELFETVTAPYYKDNGGFLSVQNDMQSIAKRLVTSEK